MAKRNKGRLVALDVLQFSTALKKWKELKREQEILHAEEKNLRTFGAEFEEAKGKLADVKEALVKAHEVTGEPSLVFLEGKPALQVFTGPEAFDTIHVEDAGHVEVATHAHRELKDAKVKLDEALARKVEREKKPTTALADFYAFVRPLVDKAHKDVPADATIELQQNEQKLLASWTA
jgi:hypothetical protein